MSTLKAVRGTRDLLPPETELWNHVEAIARRVFARYNFGEIRTPIFEDTSLFARGVGEETDIVSKEMYTWEDGERFDKDALRDAWLREHNIVSFVKTTDGHIVNEPAEEEDDDMRLPLELRIAKYKAEVIDFVGRLDNSSLKRLASAPAPYNFYGVRKRLVVASPIPAKANEEIDGVEVEYFYGHFLKSSQSLTLRPENTAGVVRAYIEHKLGDTGLLQKLFYIGPQFRRERPQKGRYRQFWQIGAEVIGPPSAGSESPLRDAEVLEMLATFLDELGIEGWHLDINSVGSATDRPRYVAALREALAPVKHLMCEDNQRRAETNPLRVLDSKDPNDQEIINNLPKIADYLDDESKAHFAAVLSALDACKVPYHVNPRLVRGLDYYTRTTFEFTHGGLGAQNALLGGGRYDGLSENIGGPKAPGIGFAMGEDRLILTLQAAHEQKAALADYYIAPLSPAQNPAALELARELRRKGLRVELGDGSFRLKKSFEVANKIAKKIVLFGEDEMSTGMLTVKDFTSGEQVRIDREQLTVDHIAIDK